MRNDTKNSFESQIVRLRQVTNSSTQTELAELLGIRQPSVAAVLKKRNLPANWLLTLATKFHINPEWILSAKLPIFITDQPMTNGSASSCGERRARDDLNNVPLNVLLEEVQRRLKLNQ